MNTVSSSAWGVLTGVRPAKIFTRMVREGLDFSAAAAEMASMGVSKERIWLCECAARESLKAEKRLEKQDICLYIGIPFCPSRCSYCSFVTHSVKKASKLVEPFLDMLKDEIAYAGELLKQSGMRIRSVYVGGGTPTTLNASQLERMFGWMADAFDLGFCDEFTVEAGRPDTIDADKLRVVHSAGADRVSINPQTFIPEVLQAIGREHSVKAVYEAFDLARSEGFKVINMDLIAGLPADSANGFEHSLTEAIGLGAENITVHTLAIKRGSQLNLEKSPVPDGSQVGIMLDTAAAMLSKAEYEPYYLYRQKRTAGSFENVGWAKSGTESFYNICIMEELCGILSLGGGGVTKMVNSETGFILRSNNPKYPYEYNVSKDKIFKAKEDFFAFYKEIL
ncbi:MAG: coproporphyrinogen dehydrogenase HemZ [Oscillospiraceae bacterium]|nr:coproporphyrinogen dehydrogenase HemZ [Oscillospiraceae bacterium]